MDMLIAAAAVFIGIHLVIAGTPIRDMIVSVIGENAYMGLFSLASLVVIVWFAIAYNGASASAGNSVLYDLGPGVRHLAIPVVAIAFLLGVQGLFMANPTAVRAESAAAREDVVKGVLRITRHPFLWGVAIWSALHLAANGDEASVIFFSTFMILAVFGTFSIDAKRRRKMGDAWTPFQSRTSNIPFAAVISGRTKLHLSESFGWRFWVAALLFLGVLFLHTWMFKVSPFPGGWIPPLPLPGA